MTDKDFRIVIIFIDCIVNKNYSFTASRWGSLVKSSHQGHTMQDLGTPTFKWAFSILALPV